MQGQFARGGVNRAHRGHLAELGRSGAASLRVLEAGDFAHAGEEALDAEMGAGENFLVEVGAKFLEGVEVGHGSSSLIKARHYRKNCGRDAKARSDQREDARPSTRPGRAPVALSELQTRAPFTKTFSMPVGKT